MVKMVVIDRDNLMNYANNLVDKSVDANDIARMPCMNIPDEVLQILPHLIEKYEQARRTPHIRKPLAWALYRAWQWVANNKEKGAEE